jgi:segregation and condensation protein B
MLNILHQHIESLIFSANHSISYDDIKSTLEESLSVILTDADVAAALKALIERYADEQYAIEIVEMAGGFRFMTKGAYHHTIGIYLKQHTQRKLSRAALETLAIVAYKQPVTKTEIESIRGVNSDYSVQKLLEKELIEISGRSEGPGKPLMYATSQRFMDYFGLRNMADLPKIKEILPIENQIGDQAPDEEQQIQSFNHLVHKEEE